MVPLNGGRSVFWETCWLPRPFFFLLGLWLVRLPRCYSFGSIRLFCGSILVSQGPHVMAVFYIYYKRKTMIFVWALVQQKSAKRVPWGFLWYPLGVRWGSCGGPLGSLWGVLDPPSPPLWASSGPLGPFGFALGVSRVHLGASFAYSVLLELILDLEGRLWAPFWAPMGPKGEAAGPPLQITSASPMPTSLRLWYDTLNH